MKKKLFTLLLLASLAGCKARVVSKPPIDARTIENTPVAVVPSEPPPMVSEEITPLTPKMATDQEKERIAALGQRVELPFAPAIAMDPVDGSKVSIRVNTPMIDYKKHIYYFSSAANRATFVANPDQFTKGSLAKYQ
jgi:YHS domain-containing protein